MMAEDSELMTEEGFELGAPALVCRWRLAGGALPLANRHLRALAQRTVTGKLVSPELVAWAKQHIEQTLWRGSLEHPEGVLMLIIDREGRAAMTVGPYTPLEDMTIRGLARRSKRAADEAFQTAARIDYENDDTGLPKSDVLSFALADGCKIIVRPSGTEPKLKAYLFAKGADQAAAEAVLDTLEALMNTYCKA
jgi:hypothetical protein